MLTQYLERYAEPEIQELPVFSRLFQHCLVIPAYAEPEEFAEKLHLLLAREPELLVILILNRPDTEPNPDINKPLLDALGQRHAQLLVVQREEPLPANEGVGLARKIGCDLACALMQAGQIREGWIHNTDADATLPAGYFDEFELINAGVVLHPFQHQLESPHELAMALYELSLHDHILELQRAQSPYAFHSLGSCISIQRKVYEQVRGFPKRAGGEDFYLLNKAAKLSEFQEASSGTLILEGRVSNRVPFGTGPALAKLSQQESMVDSPLFYHRSSYAALSAFLAVMRDAVSNKQTLATALVGQEDVYITLENMGVEKALTHCRGHSSDPAGFMRHFHQWFDGFRTLKFLHALREQGRTDQSFKELYGESDPVPVLVESRRLLGWDRLGTDP